MQVGKLKCKMQMQNLQMQNFEVFKRQVKTPRGAPKQVSFILFYSFLLPNAKRLKMKAFLKVSLVLLIGNNTNNV